MRVHPMPVIMISSLTSNGADTTLRALSLGAIDYISKPKLDVTNGTIEQAEEIVASGKADMIALARAILYDPRWPWHAAAKLGAQVDAPPQYWRCLPHRYKHLFKRV